MTSAVLSAILLVLVFIFLLGLIGEKSMSGKKLYAVMLIATLAILAFVALK